LSSFNLYINSSPIILKLFLSSNFISPVVSLAVWGSYAAKDVVGKVFISFFPIMAFVIAGFEHCVANMYYLLLGVFAKTNPAYVELSHQTAEKVANINFTHIIQNLIPATLGNIVGGGIFVGIAYWLIYTKAASTKVNAKEKIAAQYFPHSEEFYPFKRDPEWEKLINYLIDDLNINIE